MKKQLLSLLLCVLLLTPMLACAEQRVFMKGNAADFAPDESTMELYVCPLLAADAMLLRCDGVTIAVDVGKYNQDVEVLKALDYYGTRRLDAVFNSHPHDDHAAGMIKLLESDVDVGCFITAFPDDFAVRGSVQNQVLGAVRKAGIPIQHVQDGSVFYVGSAKITCFQHTFGQSTVGYLNNSSCVLLVEYGECSLLLTGDIDVQAEMALIADHPELGKVDIMKAPHHGVAYLKAEFMDALQPEFVFITNGSGDSGPSREMLDRRKIPYLYATRGPIRLTTNGSRWIVDQDLDERFRK